MYNLTKFACIYGAQSGNMCKVDHQALSYVKVLNETHLLQSSKVHFRTCTPICKLIISLASVQRPITALNHLQNLLAKFQNEIKLGNRVWNLTVERCLKLTEKSRLLQNVICKLVTTC